MLNAGVIGATGYTGEEVVRILSNHNSVTITTLQAVVKKELAYSEMFPGLHGKVDCVCEKPNIKKALESADCFFLALPHTVSMELAPILHKRGKTVIDLSADYRLSEADYEKWYGVKHRDKASLKDAVYGLPEFFRNDIKKAKFIANPGCYPTSASLAAGPLLKKGFIDPGSVIVDAKSGVTGAGRKAHVSLCFPEVNENMKAYKPDEHQHKPEINMVLSRLSNRPVDAVFVPHLIPLNRGILSTLYMDLKKGMSTAELVSFYREFYTGEPFVKIMDEGKLPALRDVQFTNYCNIGVKVSGMKAIVVSCIDNLLKGAAGQAVQNMNIMYGFPETEGLT